jgi:glucose/mannose-6-phosphate isomerase
MEESILNFPKQFGYKPKIEKEDRLKKFDHIILCGMGGSHLAADLLKTIKPGVDIYVHKDYGLPPYGEIFIKAGLLIASSYSGNTEEVISFFEEGLKRGHRVLVISTGGKLIEMAKENDFPYIQIPNTGIQPRLAIGYSMIALATLLDDQELLIDLAQMKKTLLPKKLKEDGAKLAEIIEGKSRVIYTSNRNMPIGYNWKIKLNETGKVPAFYNLFPELNHNEMQGFDVNEKTRHFIDDFHFIFIKDSNDHPRVQRRMDVTKRLLADKGFSTTLIELRGISSLEKIFNSLILADWVALFLAKGHGAGPEEVPLIEEFKKRILDS